MKLYVIVVDNETEFVLANSMATAIAMWSRELDCCVEPDSISELCSTDQIIGWGDA